MLTFVLLLSTYSAVAIFDWRGFQKKLEKIAPHVNRHVYSLSAIGVSDDKPVVSCLVSLETRVQRPKNG